jgi:hypothetical protein
MDRGLVFFTIAGVMLWLLLDDFFGKGRVGNLAASLTPDVSITKMISDAAKNTVKAGQDAIANYDKKQRGLTGKDDQRRKEIEKKLRSGEKVSTADLKWYFSHLFNYSF